jgi:serine/threonine protein kinase
MKYDDEKFIELARGRGYLDEAKLEKARHSRSEMADMGIKDEFQIGDVLLQNESITQEQHDEIVAQLTSGRIPGYELEGIIGRGMQGTVYRARKHLTGEQVAVKVLEAGGDETFMKRFAREAMAATKLKHPNIVGALDIGKEGDLYYFVSEFVEGKTVKDMMKESGVIDEPTCLRVLETMAKALGALHQAKIVHRDIQPENILFTDAGEIKLKELGMVKSTSEDAQALTMPGMVLGSLDYISPEQAAGALLDVRADIYSLGATLYHMCTGSTPWSGQPPTARASGKVPAAKSRNPGISEGLNRILMRAMQKAPDLRYQTPAELLADVERVMQGKSIGPSPAGADSRVLGAASTAPRATYQPSSSVSSGGDRTIVWAILIGVGLGLAALAVLLLLML